MKEPAYSAGWISKRRELPVTFIFDGVKLTNEFPYFHIGCRFIQGKGKALETVQIVIKLVVIVWRVYAGSQPWNTYLFRVDILPALNDGNSHIWTLMPERENVPGRVDIAVVSDTTLTCPFSYSKTGDTFRPRAGA